MDKFYTVFDLSDMFHMSEKTIRDKLTAGEIAGHKMGKEWRISQQQVDEYLRRTSNVDPDTYSAPTLLK
jgi:putative molybdopterin biosynthesis protein